MSFLFLLPPLLHLLAFASKRGEGEGGTERREEEEEEEEEGGASSLLSPTGKGHSCYSVSRGETEGKDTTTEEAATCCCEQTG